MDSSPAPGQDTKKEQSEPSPAIALLENGLTCFQHGKYSEGTAFLALAREQLSPNMLHLADDLEALLQDYVGYCQAQQVLQQASERLVQTYTKQQAHVASLAQQLSELQGETIRREQTPSPLQSTLRDKNLQPDPAHETQQTQERECEEFALPALYITCFGCFEVKRSGKTVSLCANRKGQAILRYIVTQPGHRVSIDTLMELLWPEDEPEVAHHKLQVAISALRRSLNGGFANTTGGGYILCKKGIYQLNPRAPIQTDANEFLALYQTGREQNDRYAAVPHYETACRLYRGPFLTEDLYVDWPIIQREQLNQAYFAMCGALSEHYCGIGDYEAAAKWANAILKENPCDEVAHRYLMSIYSEAGRRSEALRQYQRCERILTGELNISPMPETVSLFHTILNDVSSNIEKK